MKILMAAANYPHAGHPYGGIFTERVAGVLRRSCEAVTVLAPRPCAPRLLTSLAARWKAYAQIPADGMSRGVRIVRPTYLQIPRVGGAFWFDLGAYVATRRIAAALHRESRFDAVLCFDLGAGGIGWRIARDLGIASCGWALGGDVRPAPGSSYARALLRTLSHLDLVFYQSRELLEKASEFVAERSDGRYLVLPHGIPAAPPLRRDETRKRVRAEWGVTDDEIVALSVGRISREKGTYDILEAVSRAAAVHPRLKCVIVGSMPAFDETEAVQRAIRDAPSLLDRMKLLPACPTEQVWESLCAADLFVFPSHGEGMPNSLLEALATGLPAVAFAIPPVVELDGGTEALVTVPPFDVGLLSEAISLLTGSQEQRALIGARGFKRVSEAFMVEKNVPRAVAEIARVVEERRRARRAARSGHRMLA